MSDVIDLYGVCEADKCRRKERAINNEQDRVRVQGKNYHKGCEPTKKEQESKNKSYS